MNLTPQSLHMFRRGVVVGLSMGFGAQAGLYGLWLMLPYLTFGVSKSYAVMREMFPEWLWGAGLCIGGWTVFAVGLTMWLRLFRERPVPLWFRAVSALSLLVKLTILVSVFWLASPESGAAPLFAVALISVLVLLVSALDELGALTRTLRWAGRLWAR